MDLLSFQHQSTLHYVLHVKRDGQKHSKQISERIRMSRTLDNANPTIFAAPAAAPSSSRHKSPKSMLWDEDSAAWEEDESSGYEEREEIDAEEVYGESLPCPSVAAVSCRRTTRQLQVMTNANVQTSCVVSPIPNTQ